MTKQSAPEAEFVLQCKAYKIQVESEFKFHPVRKWRADFALPARMILIEIEGGVWVNGRHNRGSGFIADCEKYNQAAYLGYRTFRFTPDMVKSGDAIKLIIDTLKQKVYKTNP